MGRIRTEGVRKKARGDRIKGKGDVILLLETSRQWERQSSESGRLVCVSPIPSFQHGSPTYFFPINPLSISVALRSFSLLSASDAELVNKLPHPNRPGHHSTTNHASGR